MFLLLYRYSAVVLSSLLALAFGSALWSARNLQDPVHGIPTAGETGGDLLSRVRASEATAPKVEPVDAGVPVSLLSKALHFPPHADVKIPHQIPLAHYFSGYFDKQKGTAVREVEHKHVDRAGSQAKPPESRRRKRWTDLSMKVHCWNEAHVFDVVVPASEVAKYFPHEGQHTLPCNTTCMAKVPGRDVCARLKSGCTVPETELGTAQNENKQLASFEKNVDQRLRELDAQLAQLSLESSYHEDKLVELGHNLNHISDALKKQLSAASVKTLDSMDRKSAEMEALFIEKSKSMMTAIFSVLSSIQSDSATHTWTLKGYAAQKAMAIKNGWSRSRSEKVYIRLYLMSWGIQFENGTRGMTLHLSFQLHKGINDEFLEWPFSKELKLSIIHPETGEKQEDSTTIPASVALEKNFARPVEDSNEGTYFAGITFESSHLERNGYVKTDQLLLKLELL